jgi:hypothetical protein
MTQGEDARIRSTPSVPANLRGTWNGTHRRHWLGKTASKGIGVQKGGSVPGEKGSPLTFPLNHHPSTTNSNRYRKKAYRTRSSAMLILPSWDHDTKHNLRHTDTGRQTTDRTRNVATRIRLDETRRRGTSSQRTLHPSLVSPSPAVPANQVRGVWCDTTGRFPVIRRIRGRILYAAELE